jgi:hypothetical protein
MSDYINVNFMSEAMGNSYPFVISPSHWFKSGTSIVIDLQELSNQANTPNIIQIAFRGRYRYRLSTIQSQAAMLRQAQQMRSF